MKIIITILLFTLVFAMNACVDVASNNQAANGGGQMAAGEKSAMKDDAAENSPIPETTVNSNNAEAATGKNLSPDQLVEDLYNQQDNENSPFFQDKNRALVDKYFAKNLADMIWKDSVESKDEAGVLEFDPLYNAQDTEIADFAVGKPEINGEKATVVVTFTNFGEGQTVKYLLAKENDAWKIEDIDYGENSTLVKVYKDANK